VYYQAAPGEGKPVDSLEIFRPFSKPVQSNSVDHSSKNWISLFDRPFLYPFDDRASGEIFSDKRNAVFLFAPSEEAGQTARRTLLELAADWKLKYKRRLIFTEIQVQFSKFRNKKKATRVYPITSKLIPSSISSFLSRQQKSRSLFTMEISKV